MLLSDFDFKLPKDLIAQSPPNPRGSSALLYFDDLQTIHDKKFCNVLDVLSEGDVLVFNDTKVLPSLLTIHSINNQKISAQLHLVKKTGDYSWQVMAKPANKINLGDELIFDEDGTFVARVIAKDVIENYIEIEFAVNGEHLTDKMLLHGAMPLPPYIKRPFMQQSDFDSYQTVFSKHAGALAAPTAGLHFTSELLQQISAKGVLTRFLTLHVGMGTFASIKSEHIDDHKMHSEEFSIDAEVAEVINNAKKIGKKIVCVGTTTIRALESIAQNNMVRAAHNMSTNIFIKPGYKFQIADAMITNFHLPKSTLLILVSAFIGIENARNLYKHAIEKKYKFFSYGDACYLTNSVLSQ